MEMGLSEEITMSAEGIVNCGEHTSCNRNMTFVVFARIVWQELNLRMKNKTQNHVANHNNDTLTPPQSSTAWKKLLVSFGLLY